MTPTLVFDLETVPDTAGLRRLHPDWAALDDRAVAEQAFAQRRERTGSDFLPLHLQRVVAIGCVFRDDSGLRVRCLGTPGDEEPRLVQDFYRLVDRYTPQLVSWNGGGFDLPVLHYRSLLHGLVAPRYWEQGEDDRDFRYNNYISRYHARHLDLMDVMALYQPRANAPLDHVARLCGYPGKLGMDGSAVWDSWRRGEIAAIRNYCETDVANTYLVFLSYQRLRGVLDESAWHAEVELVRATLERADVPHWREFLAAWPGLAVGPDSGA